MHSQAFLYNVRKCTTVLYESNQETKWKVHTVCLLPTMVYLDDLNSSLKKKEKKKKVMLKVLSHF